MFLTSKEMHTQRFFERFDESVRIRYFLDASNKDFSLYILLIAWNWL